MLGLVRALQAMQWMSFAFLMVAMMISAYLMLRLRRWVGLGWLAWSIFTGTTVLLTGMGCCLGLQLNLQMGVYLVLSPLLVLAFGTYGWWLWKTFK